MTKKLGITWNCPESPYVVGMFHDLCKCDDYRPDMFSTKYARNDDAILPGHGDKSIIMLQRFRQLTDEEIACIRWHMGAFETDSKMWEYYGKAIEKYSTVLFTHTADMYASRVIGV